MSEIKIYNPGQLVNKQDQFLSGIMDELQEGENKVGAKEIASTIKGLMNAKTFNNAGFEMDDNKARLDAVKLVLQLNGVKTGNTINVNLFNVNKPGKDEALEF